ncbi:MAG TPA: hypothetical protein PLP89_00650 [Synergistales bacterium]|nr:hypothetical protein [Synergistales bacterium]HRV71520.1 hypothetical protein [Thermovirgaceae bacterium]
MPSRSSSPEIQDLAFVDSSGRYIDGADFSFVNLRFPRLEKILQEMILGGERNRRLVFQTGEVRPLNIEMLDPKGNFWKIWQEKETGNGVEEDPAIRFLFDGSEGIIRPADYRDRLLRLEGNRKTPQLLISSFLMHWLSGLLALHSEVNLADLA